MTAPSWRALDTTAEAVAYPPPGTASSAAAATTGSTMPTPIPEMTCPGSHCVRKWGVVLTTPANQAYAPAQISAPGTATTRWPCRSATLPSTAATTAATAAPGATARPERSRP